VNLFNFNFTHTLYPIHWRTILLHNMGIKQKLIKTRVLKISVLCIVCIIVLLVCYFKTLTINHKKEETFEKLNKVSSILYQINTIERDFFESESKKYEFYTDDVSSLKNQYADLYQKLEQNIQSLNNDLLLKQKRNLKHHEKSLSLKINQHRILWDSTEFYIKKRGFKDFGLEGEMRREIHFVEKKCPLPNLEIVLTLRRHEKDFFLRKQDIYVEKAKSTLDLLKTKVEQLNISQVEKDNYLNALDSYWSHFSQIVAIENKIGINRTDGIRYKIANQMQSIESEIKDFKDSLAINSEHQIYLISCLYLMAIFLLIIAVLLATSTSKQLGQPIKHLINSIQQSVHSDFDEKLAIYQIEDKSEIAILGTNVQKMLDKIISTRNELGKTEQELREGNIKLTNQSELLTKALSLLETKNNHLIDSIQYAKKIQNVFLPSDAKFKSLFEKSELIYSPKDIIGGDFYTAFDCENYKFLIVMDCTGHGVPGAFMTILGATIISRLKKIIQCGEEPSKIMSKFDMLFRELFSSEEFATNDGMEVAIVSINKLTNQLNFCGSKMHLITQNQNQISLIKGSKRGIGDPFRKGYEFLNVEIDLEVGDRFFLFSDGLQDQFGGEKLEKLKRKQVLITLDKHKNSSLHNQVSAIKTLLTNWMCVNEEQIIQTDDILMIGVEI
jgi:serine phosphatase RsbU (regulator of sigma subunit)